MSLPDPGRNGSPPGPSALRCGWEQTGSRSVAPQKPPSTQTTCHDATLKSRRIAPSCPPRHHDTAQLGHAQLTRCGATRFPHGPRESNGLPSAARVPPEFCPARPYLASAHVFSATSGMALCLQFEASTGAIEVFMSVRHAQFIVVDVRKVTQSPTALRPHHAACRVDRRLGASEA